MPMSASSVVDGNLVLDKLGVASEGRRRTGADGGRHRSAYLYVTHATLSGLPVQRVQLTQSV